MAHSSNQPTAGACVSFACPPAFRVVTYNVHKCCGLDRRVRPARIIEILREIDADIIALQEIFSASGSSHVPDQAREIAHALGYELCFGENRRLNGIGYGNAILSRFAVLYSHNYDISWRWRERRGCLRADISLGEGFILHVFNAHFGTGYVERRHQARRLISAEILNNAELNGARILLGDFNEWKRGLASFLLATHLQSADIRYHLGRPRTYPGILPLVHLDHIYYDSSLKLEGLRLHRTRASLIASDHLPIVADFAWG
jgi:endonuclease/exonuclease/phosphatase family metal-dependent hydrolase